MKLVVITGGIGSGKSVLSHIVNVMRYPTYDCDREAKRLMNESLYLRDALTKLLGCDAYNSDGQLNKAYVSQRIFHDEALRDAMNKLVHPAVKDDIVEWANAQDSPVAFVETALLAESGLSSIANDIWVVDAPERLRIERVVKRSGLTHEQVKARIASQTTIDSSQARHFMNDGKVSLLRQIVEALHVL